MSDVIDYQLIGDDLQAVIITLDPGEMVQAEAGAMMYMQDGIVMNTTLDPNAQGGGMMSKLFQGAKRALSGDTFFVTTFANAANKRQDVAFSSHFPGKIQPVDLRDWGGVIIGQKDSFLCAARGVSIGIAFQRRIGVGLFGGEGFIMQRLDGDGLCFVHAGGMLHELELQAGQTLRVDTGCIVALQPSVNYGHSARWWRQDGALRRRRPVFRDAERPRARLAAIVAAQPPRRTHLQGHPGHRRKPPRGRIDPRRHRRSPRRRFVGAWLSVVRGGAC